MDSIIKFNFGSFNTSIYYPSGNIELSCDQFVEEDLSMTDSINGHNKNNSKKIVNNKRKKKRKTKKRKISSDDDIIDLLMNNSDGSYSDRDSDDEYDDPDELDNNESCPNPLCDHNNNVNNIGIKNFTVIKNIDDLIELGKTYHCKTNKIYNGINLRIICNLVGPLTELQKLIGMKNVKEQIVNQIVFFLQGLNKKEKCNNCIDCLYDLPCSQNMNNDMLHTVITGPPGVGKTELGKILGHIYKSMGILSNGQMHIATRSDLIAKFLGQTAIKTQEFIDKCKGGVMLIDEVYSLGSAELRDSFSKECIDTLNQNLSERRDFLCIIVGYKESIEKCFFAYNEGLRRRFSFRYDITEYSADELMDIFLLKVHKEGWFVEFDNCLSDSNIQENKEHLGNFFRINKNYFPYYGGDIESLFLNCKIVHGSRVLFKDPSIRKILTLQDIQKGFELFVNHRDYKEKTEIPTSIRMMYT